MAPLLQDISKKKQRAVKLVNQNRLSEAKQLYQKLLKKIPSDAGAWFMLGTVEARLGNLDKAEQAMCKALQADDNLSEAWLGLGQVLEKLGREADACNTYLKALSNNPGLVEALVSLGRIYFTKQLYSEAVNYLGKAVRLGVDQPQVLSSYGDALNHRGRFKEASDIYEKLLQQFPDNANLLYKLAVLRIEFSELDQAYIYFQKVLGIDANNLDAKLGCINVLRHKKEFEKALPLAESLFETEIQSIPVAILYAKLCHLNDGCDKAVARLEGLLKNSGIPEKGVQLICFELGRLYDEKGEYDKAFAVYREGNDLKKGGYDSASFDKTISAIIGGYSQEAMLKNRSTARRDKGRPLFILGMPRSGTTLIEQILCSHPEVYGAGELTDLVELEREIRGPSYSLEKLSKEAESLTPAVLDKMSERFLDRLAALSGGERYVSDKMPGNFLMLGLISMLFPEAKIIHCIRNPVDTCLSCYFHDFSGFHPYTYDLDDLVSYYKNYQRLMAHWYNALPLTIHEVEYEALVADQENETHRMLEYLELEWDDRCMQFYKSNRVVVTSSQAQVQKPIYHSSVSRWKNYEKHIATLIEGLT